MIRQRDAIHSSTKNHKHTSKQNAEILISIVVPVYNEAANVPLLVKELSKNADKLPYSFEFLLVDDGSEDDSAAAIQKSGAADSRVKLIQLSRNFGKESAVSAGLSQSQGDAVIIMDADLQMPPSLMGQFIEKWRQGAEVVIGVFAERNMSRIRAFGAHIFYYVMGKIGHTKITPNATDYRLLDRQVVDVFNELTERNRITRGLIDWLGFRREFIYFKQAPRQHGEPTYSMGKLIQLAINSFTSYSLLPLKVAGYLGVFILTTSIPGTIFLYIERFVLGNPLNWTINSTTFLAMMTLFLVGVVLACLGLISLYIAHIHAEVINRPLYIIRRDSVRSIPGVGSPADAGQSKANSNHKEEGA